jgi:hypothetical protein
VTPPSAGPAVPRSVTGMYVAGALILVLVGLWFAFQAADGLWLETRQASAVVVGKTYREPGQTYTTTMINKQAHVVPHSTPGAYLLDLELLGKTTQGQADRELYEGVSAGDRVKVEYRRRRLTGAIAVVAVRR